MTRFTRKKIDAGNELATVAAATTTLTDLAGQLERALGVAGSCNQHYTAAPPPIRRQINQGLFKALYLDRDGEVEHVELTEPFAQLLADDLLSSVSAQAALTGEPTDRQDDTQTDRPSLPVLWPSAVSLSSASAARTASSAARHISSHSNPASARRA